MPLNSKQVKLIRQALQEVQIWGFELYKGYYLKKILIETKGLDADCVLATLADSPHRIVRKFGETLALYLKPSNGCAPDTMLAAITKTVAYFTTGYLPPVSETPLTPYHKSVVFTAYLDNEIADVVTIPGVELFKLDNIDPDWQEAINEEVADKWANEVMLEAISTEYKLNTSEPLTHNSKVKFMLFSRIGKCYRFETSLEEEFTLGDLNLDLSLPLGEIEDYGSLNYAIYKELMEWRYNNISSSWTYADDNEVMAA